MIAVCLFVLFLFGLFTLARIVTRNLATDGFKFALRAIRRRFVSTEIAAMYPNAFFDPWRAPKPRTALGMKGGWLEVVIMLNAVIAGVTAWIAMQIASSLAGWAWIAGGAVLLLAFLGQVFVVERSYKKRWRKLADRDMVTDDIQPQAD